MEKTWKWLVTIFGVLTIVSAIVYAPHGNEWAFAAMWASLTGWAVSLLGYIRS